MSLLSSLTYNYKTSHYYFACESLIEPRKVFRVHYVSYLSSELVECVICVTRKTFVLFLGQFSNVTGLKLFSWTNQSVVVTLIQAGELIDLFTYHEVVTNNSVEMKQVHKEEAGDGTASYSNKKTNDDC